MRTIFVFLSLLILSSYSLAATPEEDVAAYKAIFNGDNTLHSDANDAFSWKGISDIQLFDLIEQLLLRDYESTRRDKNEKNRVARYIRSLGFSGQPKYLPTLQKFSGDKIYNRYADAALHDLPRYQKWNPIISDRNTFDQKYSDDSNRVMNMLRTDDVFLRRVGAKRIFFGEHDAYLHEYLAKRIEADLPKVNDADQDFLDTFAWMVKALASSKDARYLDLIKNVAKTSRPSLVKRHATESLRKYYNASF